MRISAFAAKAVLAAAKRSGAAPTGEERKRAPAGKVYSPAARKLPGLPWTRTAGPTCTIRRS